MLDWQNILLALPVVGFAVALDFLLKLVLGQALADLHYTRHRNRNRTRNWMLLWYFAISAILYPVAIVGVYLLWR